MKDNWHGSIERYMLNEDDLRIYSLLFREMEYSINRMEANDKIYMMNRKLQEAAVTDMLTGIYNRAGMYEEIRQMIECYRVSEKTHHVGLMFIDLDNFKHYNDTFGHDVGDLILKEMAKIFRKAVKGRGFVARYGGDEFIMILNTDDREILEQIAKGIYEKINSTQGFLQICSRISRSSVFKIIINSSPPYLATNPLPFTALRKIFAISFKIRSPTSCPNVSL